MEAMLGTFLYSYLYFKLANTFYLCHLCFLFNKIGEQEGRSGSAWKLWGNGQEGMGGGTNNVYTCKQM
jgi:hypothetical protein